MSGGSSVAAFKVRRMRFSSSEASFLLHSYPGDSLLATIVNILLLRRRIQLPKGVDTVDFDRICSMITPLLRWTDKDWIREALMLTVGYSDVKCPLISSEVTVDSNIAKLLSLLSIELCHGSVAGQRYKRIERLNLEDLEVHVQLYKENKHIEGVNFGVEHANIATAFIQKYRRGITEKGLKLLKDKFSKSDAVICMLYYRDQFNVLISKDETLYLLMSELCFESHSCIWESLCQNQVFDERFKIYDRDISHLRRVNNFLPLDEGPESKVLSRYDPAIAKPKVQPVTEKIIMKRGPPGALKPGMGSCVANSGNKEAGITSSNGNANNEEMSNMAVHSNSHANNGESPDGQCSGDPHMASGSKEKQERIRCMRHVRRFLRLCRGMKQKNAVQETHKGLTH